MHDGETEGGDSRYIYTWCDEIDMPNDIFNRNIKNCDKARRTCCDDVFAYTVSYVGFIWVSFLRALILLGLTSFQSNYYVVLCPSYFTSPSLADKTRAIKTSGGGLNPMIIDNLEDGKNPSLGGVYFHET